MVANETPPRTGRGGVLSFEDEGEDLRRISTGEGSSVLGAMGAFGVLAFGLVMVNYGSKVNLLVKGNSNR